MSEDVGKKIKQITELLGQESMPDNVRSLLTMLASSAPKADTPPRQDDRTFSKEETSERNGLDDNLEMLRKVKKIMEHMNTNNNDPRINLLTAISPFLSGGRQKKIGNCIKLLRMSSLARLMEEQEGI